MFAALFSLALAACTLDDPSVAANPSAAVGDNRRESLSTTNAFAFAGFKPVEGIEVLGAEERAGIDRLVALAVRVPPNAVAAFLAAAHFDAGALQEGDRVFQRGIAGIDVAKAKAVAAGQDRLVRDGKTVIRDVMLVRDDPRAVVVLVWAYST